MFLGLPPWVQTAVLTGWGLNKITGGGVTGLLGKAFGAGIDLFKGRGSTPANPLFVSGVGGVGGPGGVVGGKGGGRFGGVGGIIAGTIAVTLVGEAIAIQQQISDRSTEQAQTAHESLNKMIGQGAKLSDLLTAQQAVRDGIKDIKSNPLLTIVQGQALTELESMNSQLEKAIKERAQPIIDKQAPANAAANQRSIASREAQRTPIAADPKNTVVPAVKDVGSAVKNAQSIASRENSAQKAELGNVRNAVTTMDANQKTAAVAAAATAVLQGSLQAGRDALARVATSNAGTRAATASTSAGLGIQGTLRAELAATRAAIYAARPVVQSTTVVNSYSTAQRGGSTSDSRKSGPLMGGR
jgi:hypothetical protein